MFVTVHFGAMDNRDNAHTDLRFESEPMRGDEFRYNDSLWAIVIRRWVKSPGASEYRLHVVAMMRG